MICYLINFKFAIIAESIFFAFTFSTQFWKCSLQKSALENSHLLLNPTCRQSIQSHTQPTCSTRVECLTGKMDVESRFYRSHEARQGMHDHHKMNRIRFKTGYSEQDPDSKNGRHAVNVVL